MSPSRYTNPFSSCWTRPGAMTFRFPAGVTARGLVAKLAEQGWRGAIVGPHGAGKSTLIEALLPAIGERGRTVHRIALRDGQRWWPEGFLSKAVADPQAVVVVDGHEQLSLIARAHLSWSCRRTGSGLLVTSHAPTALRTLIRLSPDQALVEELVEVLSARSATPVSAADLAASHACHGSNVREIFFDLYDRHEQFRRSARTAVEVRA